MKRKLSKPAKRLSHKISRNCAERAQSTIRLYTAEISEDCASATVTPHSKRRRSDANAAEVLRSDTHLLESIRMKIMELQSELYDLDDAENVDSPFQITKMNARILGFAACAQETFRFLHDHGVDITDQLYIKLNQAFSERM